MSRSTCILLLSMGVSLSAYAETQQRAIVEPASGTNPPSIQDVVGDLDIPYAGPLRVFFDDDAIIINVGGNVGPFAIQFADGRHVQESLDIVGMGLLTYDDTTGVFAVAVNDFTFQMTIRAKDPSSQLDGSDNLDNSDCPPNRKCCECETTNGGSARAVCLEDERPICTCNPCCTSTCIKLKKTIEGVLD